MTQGELLNSCLLDGTCHSETVQRRESRHGSLQHRSPGVTHPVDAAPNAYDPPCSGPFRAASAGCLRGRTDSRLRGTCAIGDNPSRRRAQAATNPTTAVARAAGSLGGSAAIDAHASLATALFAIGRTAGCGRPHRGTTPIRATVASPRPLRGALKHKETPGGPPDASFLERTERFIDQAS
jgi:hypothetical protein